MPPGWEKDWPVNGIYYDMFECERMSIGPFERGPVHGVIEQFSDATPPPECTKGTYTQDVMMANWWIDDADIAAYLAGLGMPVHFANVTVEQTDGAGASVYTWRWQGDGDESWVTFESNNLSYEVFDRVQRIFWFTNSMVGQMDLSMEENYSLPLTGAGQMAPPSIYAFTGSPTPFAPVRGGIYTQLGLSANLRYFGDFECKKPLS